MENYEWCLVSVLGQKAEWCLSCPVGMNDPWKILDNLRLRAISAAAKRFGDHGNFAESGTDSNDMLNGLLHVKMAYIGGGRHSDLWVRQNGTYCPKLPDDVVHESVKSLYPPFPKGGVIVCENDAIAPYYILNNAKETFPDQEINLMTSFRYRSNDELEYAFKRSTAVYFDSSLVSMDWLQMLLAAWTGTHLPIYGKTRNEKGWQMALDIAKTCGADFYMKRI